VDRPRGLGQPREQVLVGAVVAGEEHEIRVALRVLAQPGEDLALVRPRRLHLDDLVAALGNELRVGQGRLERRDQLVGDPVAELRVDHAVVPDEGEGLVLDEAARRAVDEVVEDRAHAVLPVRAGDVRAFLPAAVARVADHRPVLGREPQAGDAAEPAVKVGAAAPGDDGDGVGGVAGERAEAIRQRRRGHRVLRAVGEADERAVVVEQQQSTLCAQVRGNQRLDVQLGRA
jgi:hypothetical protein